MINETTAVSTPATDCRARSTVPTHEEQVIPPTCKTVRLRTSGQLTRFALVTAMYRRITFLQAACAVTLPKYAYVVTQVENNPSFLLPSLAPFCEFAPLLRPPVRRAFVHVMLRACLPSVKLFHALIESAFNIVGVSPVNLRFNNDGMSLQATSPYRIGLLHVVLSRTAFDYYQCPAVTIIGVNCQSLLSALKFARHNDRITLTFNHDDTATTADARTAAGASILRLRFDEDDAHIIGCFQFYCAQVAVDDLNIRPESEFAYNADGRSRRPY